MSDHKKWLNSLKPGDSFYQKRTIGRIMTDELVLFTVAKRTATQIVMTNGMRFRADTGVEIGRWIHKVSLSIPPSPLDIRLILAEIGDQSMIRRLQQTNWREVPIEKIRAVCKLLDEVTT